MKFISLRAVKPPASNTNGSKFLYINPDAIQSFERNSAMGSFVWFKDSEVPIEVVEHPNEIELSIERLTPTRTIHEIDSFNQASEFNIVCLRYLNSIHTALLLNVIAIALVAIMIALGRFRG